MTTWLEIYELLETEISKLIDPILKGHGSSAALEAALKAFATNQMPDDRARQLFLTFAQTGTWVSMTNGEAYEVWLRLRGASDFVRFVAGRHLEQNRHWEKIPVSAPEMLSWLLIDYWNRAGIWQRLYAMTQ